MHRMDEVREEIQSAWRLVSQEHSGMKDEETGKDGEHE